MTTKENQDLNFKARSIENGFGFLYLKKISRPSWAFCHIKAFQMSKNICLDGLEWGFWFHSRMTMNPYASKKLQFKSVLLLFHCCMIFIIILNNPPIEPPTSPPPEMACTRHIPHWAWESEPLFDTMPPPQVEEKFDSGYIPSMYHGGGGSSGRPRITALEWGTLCLGQNSRTPDELSNLEC